MAPTKGTLNALDGLTPAVEEGVNMLVTFQLRKENAALLEKQAANERIVQACITATNEHFQQVNERLDSLEAKLSDLESEEKRDREAIVKWSAEAKALKRQAEEGLGRPSSAPEGAADRSERRNVEPSGTSTRAPALPSTTSTSSASNEQPSDATTAANGNISKPPHAATTNMISRTTRRAAARVSSCIAQKQPLQAPESPEPRALRSRQPKTAQPKSAQPTKLPRLVQGTSQLKVYFNKANAAFSTVPKDVRIEVEFIAAFLKGLQQGKQRESLAKELVQQHPSRMGRNGKVEILCKWQDVGDGLRQIGLLESDGQAGPPAKKRKILIPREMIEAGMMR